MPDDDLRSLVERGAALTDRYVRTGAGSAAGRAHLDEAISLLDRAHGRLEPDQALRGQLAGQLGWLYGVRHLAHGGSPQDRSTGMDLLDECLRFASVPPVLQNSTRIMLGQLLLAGSAARFRSPDAIMQAMRNGAEPGSLGEADRAIALFRAVADGPPISTEMISVARTLITVAEALRGMLGGPGGMDLSRMSQVFAAMQGFAQQHGSGGIAPPPIPDLSAFAPPTPTVVPSSSACPPQASPRPRGPFAERPEAEVPLDGSLVAVIDGRTPVGGPEPSPRPASQPLMPAAELRVLLGGQLGSSRVDARVALAAELVEAPGAEPADHLALAGALIARYEADGGGGWDDDTSDIRAAADSLNKAAAALPGRPPSDVLTAVRLAERVDALLPGIVRLEDGYADVAADFRDAGVEALVYTSSAGSVAFRAAPGRFERDAEGTRWSGRIAATGPVGDDVAVSYVRNADQLALLIRRGRRTITANAVFVANPRRDREHATIDALRLRRAFYPRSAGLGWTVDQVDGIGTADEVRARLGASLLHLGCGITEAGNLKLAGLDELTSVEIASQSDGADGPGGVAVLPPDPVGVAPLAEALLASGFSAVIGFEAPVPDQIASLVYWKLHAALVDDKLDPATAVATVRAWLRDPRRQPPDLLNGEYQMVAQKHNLADPVYTNALICHGF